MGLPKSNGVRRLLEFSDMKSGFVPPPYPYDRLNQIREIPSECGIELLDLSIGTPYDPVPEIALEVIDSMSLARSYPASLGSARLRESAAAWMLRRLAVEVPVASVAACVGSKEFVASLPSYLKLRDPSRNTVLYPSVSYPTYEMGAKLAGCNAVAVPILEDGQLDLDSLAPSVLEDTLCCWLNSPANPTGKVSDYTNAVEMGRKWGFVVVSDECYIEFTWSKAPQTVLQHGCEGVLALHSLSKRSNFAGGRVGFYAGDQELVSYLSEVRKHAGLMAPGPMQLVAAALLDDQHHVEVQAKRYVDRLSFLGSIARSLGLGAEMPEGGFYLWLTDSRRDGFELARYVASRTGIVGSPGEFYGQDSVDYLRIAAVADTQTLAAIAAKLMGE